MSRRRTPDRFPALIDAAIAAFIAAGGYRRTQVGDIARLMGVAKGTVYLYAQSKAALFHLAVQHADQPRPAAPPALPIPDPAPGQTAALLRARLAEEARFTVLSAALAAPGPDPHAELCAVIAEVYDTFSRNATAIRLINAAARDLPELGRVWFGGARSHLLEQLTAYITARTARGDVAPLPSAAVGGRLILESTLWFAVHRRWDPRPDGLDDALVRQSIVAALARSIGGGAVSLKCRS